MGNTFVEQIVSQLDHLHAALDPQLYFNNAIILIEQTFNQLDRVNCADSAFFILKVVSL